MKKIAALFCTALLSFSVTAASNDAGSAQGSSQAGPWVDCVYPDGSENYIPLMFCQRDGGVRKY